MSYDGYSGYRRNTTSAYLHHLAEVDNNTAIFSDDGCRFNRFRGGFQRGGIRYNDGRSGQCTTLSGNNGSWTNTDDVKIKQRTRKHQRSADRPVFPPPPLPPRSIDASKLAVMARSAVGHAVSALGNFVMGPTGMQTAKRAVATACKLYGSGDYHTPDERPVVNSIIRGNPTINASFSTPSSSLHEINIAATEPLGAVVTGTVAGQFSVVSFDINAAVRKAFPQLSVLAGLYTEYLLEGMVIKFISNASEYATGGIGDFMMVHQCNPLVPAPAGPQSFLQYDNAVSCKMSQNAMLGVECRTFKSKDLLIRSADNPAIPRTATDAGRLYVATNPAPTYSTNAVIGQLFVTYHIVLKGMRPDARPDGYLHLERTGVTNATPMGTSSTRAAVLGGAFNGVTVTNNTLTFENLLQGDVIRLTFLYSNGPAVVTNFSAAPTLSGMALYNAYVNNTSNARVSPLNGVSSAVATVEYTLIVNAALGQSVSFAIPVSTWTIPGADLIVMGQIIGSGISLTEA